MTVLAVSMVLSFFTGVLVASVFLFWAYFDDQKQVLVSFLEEVPVIKSEIRAETLLTRAWQWPLLRFLQFCAYLAS